LGTTAILILFLKNCKSKNLDAEFAEVNAKGAE